MIENVITCIFITDMGPIMDKKELKELDMKKAEEYGKINKKYLKNKKDEIDILDFYQGTNLNPPYSAANSATSYSIKPYQLFPFFKTVIVDILPLPNEELFNEYYGMSIEELIELEEKGKVVVRLPDMYSGYSKIEDDYLDPIFSLNPPSSFLINGNYGYLINDKIQGEMEDFHNLFKKEFDFGNNLAMEMGMIDPYTIASFDMINGSNPYLANVGDETYKKVTHNNFNRLSFSGYNNVNNFLKELLSVGNGRLDWAFAYSTAYASFLADPILSSLNGTHMANYNMKEILNDLIIRTSSEELRKSLLNKSSDILCYDVGKTLTDEISAPLLFNLQESLDYDYQGAIKALKSLEKVIDSRNKNEIIDLTNELKNEIYEAGQIAENMREAPEKNAKRIEKISTVISYIGEWGGALTDDPQVKPLLDALDLLGQGGEMISQTQTLQKVIERAVKFNKTDHVLYLYNNYEIFSFTPKTSNDGIIKSRRPFNGDLYEKYEYYEYIYREIPIIRVLIDITSRLTVGEGPSLKYMGEDEAQGAEVLEFLKEWQGEYLPNEAIRLFVKCALLYGSAYHIKYIVKKDGKVHINPILIDPKSIRPIYKNSRIVGYEIINENGKKEIIKKGDIGAFNPQKNISMIEKYMPMLDIIYPEITNKDKRPKLLYDTIYENLGEKFELTRDGYNKSMRMLLNTLNVAQNLDNLVCIIEILLAWGDLNRKFNYNEKALGIYEQAQKAIEGKVCSNVMKKLENDLADRILEIKRLL